MKYLDRAVDRPLPVFLAAGLVILAGVWSLLALPIKRSPTVEIPYSIVVVPYAGATPEDVESEITIDLEEKLHTLDDLRHISSISAEGASTHFLQFEDRTDMVESLRDVRDKVSLAEADFPEDADVPLVKELSFDDQPIVFFTLHGEVDLFRLREIAEDLRPALESVPGVSQVDVFGGFEREVRVLADPAVLAHYGLTLGDLADALSRQGANLPAGEMRTAQRDQLLRATGEFRSLDEIRDLAVRAERGGVIALRDIATVEVAHERLTSAAWLRDEPSVTLIVRRRPEVNTMETVALLRERMEGLRTGLSPTVRIETSSDSAEVIGRMIRQLGVSAVLGMTLVGGILFVMFGFRQALLVGCVLPFSLLFTFIGLRIFGMEISNIALFALILILGLVVDGAIIVGEAIFSEREAGSHPATAAKAGIGRVGLPVISADLTTICAFVPMLLMIGVMGQFMSVLPKVVTFALIGSIFVDHLLLPAASAKIGIPRRGRSRPRAPDGLPWFSPELPRIRRLYVAGLDASLRRRAPLLVAAVAAFLAAALSFGVGFIDSIFLPATDRGRLTLDFNLPQGDSLRETSRVGLLLGREVESIPEVTRYVLTAGETGALSADYREGGRAGPEYGRFSIELQPAADRERSQAEIVAELRRRTARYAGVQIEVSELGEGPPVGAALLVRVKGQQLDEIVDASRRLVHTVAALPGARDVRVDYDPANPELRVEVDRARAASDFGISPNQVSRALRAAFTGLEVGRMWVGDERVDIRVQAVDAYARDAEQLRELPLRTASDTLVPLGELARVEHAFSHDAIFRHDTRRAVTVRADVAGGYSSVALASDARAAIAALSLPPGVDIEYGGETEERDRSYGSLWSALKWAVLLIYVVIAVQFNSLRQPVIVLLTIPLAVTGVTAGLLVTGTPFSFMVFIGIVSLTGIVVNDGIVMIDAINQRRRAGMPIDEAIRYAAPTRLRAVLLTTITTVAGLLPLTLNISDGAEFWAPLGVTIISGLLLASGLTLFVVPVLYSLFEGAPRSPLREERVPRWSPAEVIGEIGEPDAPVHALAHGP